MASLNQHDTLKYWVEIFQIIVISVVLKHQIQMANYVFNEFSVMEVSLPLSHNYLYCNHPTVLYSDKSTIEVVVC